MKWNNWALYLLLQKYDGKVVGHLDVIISEELRFGHFLLLNALMVHKSYRRKGVATALIQEAERVTRSNGGGLYTHFSRTV